MSLVHSFDVGRLRCHTLEAGLQRLDGGAMFGVVPRVLWERQAPPDELHRIPLAMRCLLIEHPNGLVLVDTGAGNKDDAAFRDIYGMENRGARGPTQLEDAIAEAGHAPADVRWVINTHLHFDHAGGNTFVPGAGAAPEISFPGATYVVRRRELEFARHTNERTRASYLPPNFEPVAAAGRFELIDDDRELLPGIDLRLTPGHVPFHQAVVVHDGAETAAFIADLIPTSVHLRLPWIMGYDLEPLRTLETKRVLLADAEAGRWRLIFEHDPRVAMGRVVRRGKHIELDEIVESRPNAG